MASTAPRRTAQKTAVIRMIIPIIMSNIHTPTLDSQGVAAFMLNVFAFLAAATGGLVHAYLGACAAGMLLPPPVGLRVLRTNSAGCSRSIRSPSVPIAVQR